MPRRPRPANLLFSLPLTLTLMACVVAALPATPTPTTLPEPTATPRAAPTNQTAAATTPPAQSTTAPALAAAGHTLYADALAGGWNDWSWDPITRDLTAAAPVHSGAHAIAVTYTGGWGGLKLAYPAELNAAAYDTLRFWVHGGPSGGQQVTVMLEGTGGSQEQVVITPTANAWTQVSLALTALGNWPSIAAVDFFNNTDHAQPVFYLDDLSFESGLAPTPTAPPPGAGPTLSVDAAQVDHTISPYIYGLNFAEEALAEDIDLPVNRWGGNATTRYNWQLDISNHASDWFFQNIPNDVADEGALPSGSAGDAFVAQNNRTNTETLLTVPLIGWAPKGPRERACGFSISKYGAQQSAAPDNSDCGNGVQPGGAAVTGNDPTDTSLAITPGFVTDWMAHLAAEFGPIGDGGVRFYNLDNEPMLWSDTHRDVHPAPNSYDEMRDRTYAYAAAIKAADPQAQTLGPVAWGWVEYFYSALDVAAGGDWWNTRPDRLAHGDLPYVPWYLAQMQAYETAHGVRLLDYLDLHLYPQAAGLFSPAAGSAATQALRLESTQQLWNPDYLDGSWIDQPIYLIPRMRAWVDAYYPGTKLAISEYNWGALNHINGAVAQADVLGIFGREGLDLATLWDPPTSSQPGAFAFRLYRNYDGQHHRFGSQSVSAASSAETQVSVFAARRPEDGALTIVVINKSLTTPLTSALSLSGFDPAPAASVYRYSAANLSAILPLPDQPVTAAGFTATYPAQSITLFVLPPRVPFTPRAYLPLLARGQ
ncbi:MAG: hypothetical protein IT317_21810 [Anaerolineales bacterium]|nr:hypothetical protein [Anaerolineales bacterium]